MTRKGISVTITSTYKSVTCRFVEIALLLERTRVLKALFVRRVIFTVLKDRIFINFSPARSKYNPNILSRYFIHFSPARSKYNPNILSRYQYNSRSREVSL
jgi:hypothetical protein